MKDRLEQAILFNEGALTMEEKLVCFPDKIRELCELFDGVDGQKLTPWSTIDEESLTAENLKKWQRERKSSTNEIPRRQFPSNEYKQAATPEAAKNSERTKSRETPMKEQKSKGMERHGIRHFDNNLITVSKKWFAITLSEGEEMPTFPSTNILALIFQQYKELFSSDNESVDVALDTSNWDIASFKESDDKILYKARFLNESVPFTPVFGRGKNKLPKWIKKSKRRPTTAADAKECVPPTVECPTIVESKNDGLLFESIEDAVKMESAFWLNQQFCHAGKSWIRHWYAHSMDQMIAVLEKHSNSN